MKLKSLLFLALIAMTATATVTTYVYSQRSDHEILYGEIEALSDIENGQNMRNGIVGCVSSNIIDWKQGCCIGTGVCDSDDPCPDKVQKCYH